MSEDWGRTLEDVAQAVARRRGRRAGITPETARRLADRSELFQVATTRRGGPFNRPSYPMPKRRES